MISWSHGSFHWGYFLLALLGTICINAGLDMSNDYFDHTSGVDEVNQELTPFSGGSRVIQEGLLTPKQVLMGSLLFYLCGIVIGLYLTAVRGWGVLVLGMIGVFLAFFHNAPPVRLYYLAPGLGNLAAGAGCGPVIVLGAYYVQAQRWGQEAFWASIPMGLLVAAILYINEFPDSEADRKVGKKTVAAVAGRERAAWGYVALLVAAYVVLAAGVVLRIFPPTVLLALLTMPLAYRSARGALRFYDDTPNLIPFMAGTIQLHLSTGLLLCLGYAIAGIL
jgi:1,4-dihydroxy-2-naphthoate octaprenyltransferase